LQREVQVSKVTDETNFGTKGLLLHVFKDVASKDYEVWWNLDMEFDGICIGSGKTRREAIDDAYKTLSELSVVLDEAAAHAVAGGADE
jgi:hypothetical protein